MSRNSKFKTEEDFHNCKRDTSVIKGEGEKNVHELGEAFFVSKERVVGKQPLGRLALSRRHSNKHWFLLRPKTKQRHEDFHENVNSYSLCLKEETKEEGGVLLNPLSRM